MDRYVCVHGHFYQPPRENPSLEAVEMQDSAYPYHDWNERVTAECYAPNATSRLLDSDQHIVAMVNNYANISFNFGPTLLSWMEANAPTVYRAILDADSASRDKFGGHGSALAQAYNHMIMPLANRRDKVTQVKWGIADFQHRFGRAPEGMWLPETAVDNETLQVLAENGIQFTILAPSQATRVRRMGSRSWKDVSGARIDPSRAYLVRLASRRAISVFFYDGPISHGVAFEGLLDDGKRFAERLLSGLSDSRDWPQLSHIATDGESYGHHHHRGEMALTYALHYIEENKLAEFVNYGQYLERHLPTHFADIYQDSSWSCVHGVERWKSDCGCNTGRAGWNQQWRAPLREALDWLRDTLAPAYEKCAGNLLGDPWSARDDYIRVILDRSPENVERFLADHAKRPLQEADKVKALKLLEIQRNAMLMYTSCGWFFDELSGIETVQVIQYAGRAIRLAQEVLGDHIEDDFIERLRQAKGNLPEHGDGGQIYEKWVKPAVVDIPHVAAHFAISSIFEPERNGHARIYCYDVERKEFSLDAEGKMRLATGRGVFSSEITRESADLSFAALHFGDQNILGGVRPSQEGGDFQAVKEKLSEAFSRADTAEVVHLLHEEFGKNTHTLRSIFGDERRKILNLILNDMLEVSTGIFRSLYETHAQIMRFLIEMHAPVPKGFQIAAEIALNAQLRKAIESDPPDSDAVRGLLKEAASVGVDLDTATLEYAIRKKLEKKAEQLAAEPLKQERPEALKQLLELAESLPFDVELATVQNVVFAPLRKLQARWDTEDERGTPEGQKWLEILKVLRDRLKL